MAEDIDIEEHGVMEDMYPIITNIKTEAPEYMDNDDQLDEEYSDGSPERVYSRLAPTTSFMPDTYPSYNNKIILGSKPASSSDEEVIPEEHKHPVVLLDNCDDLLNIDCFCSDCETLFPTPNALDAHKMISHSFLVAVGPKNMALKSTAKPAKVPKPEFSNICNHCNLGFADQPALIQHLYDILQPVKPCECGASFKTLKELNSHKLTHNEAKLNFSNRNDLITPMKIKTVDKVLTKVVPANEETDGEDINYYVSRNKVIINAVIPKSVIFKCKECVIHFVTPVRLVAHGFKCARMAESKISKNQLWTCGICKRVFKKVDKNVHEAQHKVCDKFKVFTNHKNIESRVLCECPRCNVWFTENDFWDHWSADCAGNKGNSTKCGGCNVFINNSSLKKHMKHHNKWKKNGGFLKISFVDPRVREPELPSMHVRNSEKIKLYFCYFCHCSYRKLGEKQFRDKHNTGVCVKNKFMFCDKCGLKILIRSAAGHMKMHRIHPNLKLSDFQFLGYNDCKEILLKAPDYPSCKTCKTHVLYPKLHKCGEKETTCGICHKKFNAQAYILHRPFHFYPEVEPSKSKLALKRKLLADNSMEPKPKKILSETPAPVDPKRFRLYFCAKCRLYFACKKSRRYHASGACIKLVSKMCRICGLHFSFKGMISHINFHKMHKDLTLDSFAIYRLHSNGRDAKVPIKPPIPSLPLCKKCKLVCIHRGQHKCVPNAVGKLCQMCNIKFEPVAYKYHMAYHNYRIYKNEKPKKVAPVKSEPVVRKQEIIVSEEITMPEIMKKYESFEKIWDILYRCATCETVTDAYDDAVVHSQRHYSNMEHYDVDIKKCHICHYKFYDNCFDKHCQLHLSNPTLNMTSFKTITYKYEHLISSKWMDMFSSLPVEQIRQIVSKSIYFQCRTVRMELVRLGPPELTLYRCVQCQSCVEPKFLTQHTDIAACQKIFKFICEICNYTFISKSFYEHHVAMHEDDEKINKKSFRMVDFNKPSDSNYNNAIKEALEIENDSIENESKLVVIEPEVSKRAPSLNFTFEESEGDDEAEKIYTFFKCKYCNVSHMNREFIRNHKCFSKDVTRYCGKCKLNIVASQFHEHMEAHTSYRSFKREHFSIVVLDFKKEWETPDSEYKTGTIFECACKISFLSLKSVQAHYTTCKTDSKLMTSECGKCFRMFPTGLLANHTVMHHREQSKAPKVVLFPSMQALVNIYKCMSCSSIFHIKIKVDDHVTRCDPSKIRRFKCDKCGMYIFSSDSGLHKRKDCQKIHQENRFFVHKVYPPGFAPTEGNDASDDDQPSVSSIGEHPSVSSENDTDVVAQSLHRCKSCKLTYLHHKSIRDHFVHNHEPGNRNKVPCKACGLTFPVVSFKKYHKDVNGVFKCRFKDISISDYDVNGKVISVTKFSVPAITNSVDEDSVPETISPILTKYYNKILYQCSFCLVVFGTTVALIKHTKQRNHNIRNVKCSECGLHFVHYYYPIHKKRHHDVMKLTADDYEIYNENDLVNNTVDTIVCDPDIDESTDKILTPKVEMHDPDESKELESGVDETIAVNTEDISQGSDNNTGESFTLRTTPLTFKVLVESENNWVFKCFECGISFLTPTGLSKHIPNCKTADKVVLPCTACGNRFTRNTRHAPRDCQFVGKNVEFLGLDNVLFKCVHCDIYFINANTVKSHFLAKHYHEGERCKYCNLTFTTRTMDTHIKNHHSVNSNSFYYVIPYTDNAMVKTKTEVDDESQISQSNLSDRDDKSNDDSQTSDVSSTEVVKLYKCAACNVHFLTQSSCYKHTQKHVPLEAKEFIECKLCGLQFKYSSLHVHIKKHHDVELSLENILIEEYEVSDDKKPKIDIYRAIDKVQSKFVSTTSDVLKNVDSKTIEPETTSTADLVVNEGIGDSNTNNIENNQENASISRESDQKHKTGDEIDSSFSNKLEVER